MSQRTCTRCGITKDSSMFRHNGKRIYKKCKACSPAHRRNKKGERWLTVLENILEKSNGCSYCGERDILCLSFYYTDKNIPQYNLHKLLWGKDLTPILEELKKCGVLCSNCALKRQGKRYCSKLEAIDAGLLSNLTV